ncbi:glyceraldehyde 3-phosphate dehydrogenase NAD-binding domain-containing protein [Roseibium porphyridii]|uniref:Glyceraldehyde 3-phosphate dehydrogenase NAD-binding domain-containing protein n=1 Tax=Roseibium porphyridii TaxID=2866279 RepID=A0ABY8F5X0_9HYPH|nr:glyceraldehyde 3-phosphate dehydrogenase NAD-binding domain-containing protein [Roseibium sp. KMA01]WFE90621.1 glyceraldehyde 3-phosphate dehydrogenase NAD-binding domain-containing protein [Roseibium sp. KMA01]
MQIVINGFGRIGRTVLRQVLEASKDGDVEVVRINDIASLETCAYLFKYDSVFGPWPGNVTAHDGVLAIDGRQILFSSEADLSQADLTGVDVVMECTGKANTRIIAERGLVAGAANVLISGPSDAADVTLVLGANEDQLADQQVVSNGSCTTNALAPLLRGLDDAVGIDSGHMTTIHCYTGSQPMVDAPRGPLERSRAGGVSMVPTTTSATKLVGKVLPQLDGRVSGAAVRVPAISVSAVDLTVTLNRPVNAPFNDWLQSVFADNPVIGFTEDRVVSTDMRARPESLIIALPETLETNSRQVRLFGWYDNEWGFSARMIEMARLMAARKASVNVVASLAS